MLTLRERKVNWDRIAYWMACGMLTGAIIDVLLVLLDVW